MTVPLNADGSAYRWTITGAWIVFAVWALAAALAVIAVGRRDVCTGKGGMSLGGGSMPA